MSDDGMQAKIAEVKTVEDIKPILIGMLTEIDEGYEDAYARVREQADAIRAANAEIKSLADKIRVLEAEIAELRKLSTGDMK